MGIAMMGTGVMSGENRTIEAAKAAISSPLLEGASMLGARGVIINITGGHDMSLMEVNEASLLIQEAAHEDANIIFGAVVDPELKGKVKITVIATGFDRVAAIKQATASAAVTPVDLHSYTAYQATEKVAAAGGGGGSRLSVSRRSVLEMPVVAAASEPSQTTFGPGAEFEPVSPLDVPAFLRRQNE
jgi:cell division GTPase FtsZ